MNNENHLKKMENARIDAVKAFKRGQREMQAQSLLHLCNDKLECALRVLLKVHNLQQEKVKRAEAEPLGIFKDLQETVDELNGVLSAGLAKVKAAEAAKEDCKC